MSTYKERHRLTDAERARIRGHLNTFIAEHSARAPYGIRFLDAAEAFLANVRSLAASPRARLSGFAAVLMLFIGGTTAYAAQSALPGDPLYAVKINVTERIAAALSGSPQGHARYDAELAALRLEEAEKLASQNRLSVSVAQEIQANLAQVTADFNTNVAQLATSSSAGATAASDAQSDLEATLSAHAQVLTALSAAVPDASSSLTTIASAVHAHIDATLKAQTKLDSAIAASSTIPLASTTRDLQQSATQALDNMQALVSKVDASLGASSSAAVEVRAQAVKRSLAEGQAHLDMGSYGKAIGAFQAAIRSAQRTQAAVDATVQLKKFASDLPLSLEALSVASGDAAAPADVISATSTATTTPASSATSTNDVPHPDVTN